MQSRRALMIRMATAVVACLLFCDAAGAATAYVSDHLSINMRRGPGTNHKVVKLLDVGEKLDTLSASNGWTRVRTASGDSGYVVTQFLSSTPVASVRLEQIRQKNQALTDANADLKQKLARALPGSDSADEPKSDLVQQNKTLKSQLQDIRETSADAIRLGNENRKYREQLISLRSDVDRLRHENKRLQSRREGMKIGALILGAGTLLGLVLPLFRRRQSGKWNSL